MIYIESKIDCCGCHGCMNACPTNAIQMVEDEYGFKYPKIDKTKCINCGLCEKVCPIKNNKTISNKPKVYACYNKDENIRINSSSGGIFTLLAEFVINKKGIVFGAAFDEKFKVKHIKIDSKDEINKLRNSKYVQSEIGNTYKECKDFLEKGKEVLYTGTPCQIEGLLSYLNKKYTNLYTMDIICHGVPSPKVWQYYLKYRNKIDKEIPKKINFRNKDCGWNSFNLKFDYNEKSYSKKCTEDLYMKSFLKNIDLRDSCYNCKFKKENRLSDITLADFWGIETIFPDLKDNRGISLVIINNDKGKEILENIKQKMYIKEFDFSMVSKLNSALTKSAKINKYRDKFLKKINDVNFNKIVNTYVSIPNLPTTVKNEIKKFIKHTKLFKEIKRRKNGNINL